MEHLFFMLIKFIWKALTEKSSSTTQPLAGQQPPPPRAPSAAPTRAADAWEDYRRKQAAMERDVARKSPSNRR